MSLLKKQTKKKKQVYNHYIYFYVSLTNSHKKTEW